MASNSGNDQAKPKGTGKRGFAAMDEATQRSIASKGGQAAHQKGTAHEFDSEEARRAGSMSHKNDRVSQSSQSASGGNRGSTEEDQDSDSGGNKGGRGSRSKS